MRQQAPRSPGLVCLSAGRRLAGPAYASWFKLLVIYLSRSGKVLGKYTAGEIAKLLKSGQIQPGDFWWTSGMKVWVKISDKTPPNDLPETTALSTWGPKDWRTRPPVDLSVSNSTSASDKQIELIKTFGITPPADISKADASRWIDNLIGNEAAEAARNEKQIAEMIKAQKKATPSGNYRREMQLYIESAEEIRKSSEQEIQDEMKEAESMMSVRVDFWDAVIKTANAGSPNGDADALDVFMVETGEEEPPPALLKGLLKSASSLGRVYPRNEIEGALKKADAQSKDWDESAPDLVLRILRGD